MPEGDETGRDRELPGERITIEGLAPGAFGMMYRPEREPLLEELLRTALLDGARHVRFVAREVLDA